MTVVARMRDEIARVGKIAREGWLEQALEELIAAVRTEAFEEAARIAEAKRAEYHELSDWHGKEYVGGVLAAQEIVAAICARAQEKP